MVAVEPERRQRPETPVGNPRLKGQVPFRGGGTRDSGILFILWRGLRMAKAAPLGNKIGRDKPKPLSKAELPQP